MITWRLLVGLMTLTLFAPTPVRAKGKPPSPPPPAPAVVADPLPSARLQAYAGNNLEHLIGPLNDGALPRAELMQMKVDFRGRLGLGASEEKAMLQAAIDVCLAFDKIMDEREKAVVAMRGSGKVMTSSALGATRTGHLKDWRDDLQAKREQQEAKARQQQAKNSDSFITSTTANTANNQWRQRVQPWREQMLQLLAREKQAELASPVGVAATAAAEPVTPAGSAPLANHTAAGTEEADPVVGPWMLEGRSLLKLEADHRITGERNGRWVTSKSNDGKRHYELYWNPPKDWIDYVVLSDDGQTLNGKTRGDRPMAAVRP